MTSLITYVLLRDPINQQLRIVEEIVSPLTTTTTGDNFEGYTSFLRYLYAEASQTLLSGVSRLSVLEEFNYSSYSHSIYRYCENIYSSFSEKFTGIPQMGVSILRDYLNPIDWMPVIDPFYVSRVWDYIPSLEVLKYSLVGFVVWFTFLTIYQKYTAVMALIDSASTGIVNFINELLKVPETFKTGFTLGDVIDNSPSWFRTFLRVSGDFIFKTPKPEEDSDSDSEIISRVEPDYTVNREIIQSDYIDHINHNYTVNREIIQSNYIDNVNYDYAATHPNNINNLEFSPDSTQGLIITDYLYNQMREVSIPNFNNNNLIVSNLIPRIETTNEIEFSNLGLRTRSNSYSTLENFNINPDWIIERLHLLGGRDTDLNNNNNLLFSPTSSPQNGWVTPGVREGAGFFNTTHHRFPSGGLELNFPDLSTEAYSLHHHFMEIRPESLPISMRQSLNLNNIDLNSRIVEQLNRLNSLPSSSSVSETLQLHVDRLNIFNPAELTLYRAVDSFTRYHWTNWVGTQQERGVDFILNPEYHMNFIGTLMLLNS